MAAIVALSTVLSARIFAEETWHFRVQPEQSRFTIQVGKAGFLKVFGHDHLVSVAGFQGRVDWQPDAPESSKVSMEVRASSLTVEDPGMKEGERAEVQKEMEDEALAIDEYPKIGFESTKLDLRKDDHGELHGNIVGELTLHGVTKRIEISLHLTVSQEKLHASGRFELKGSDYRVPRVSGAGGTVKTQDKLKLVFDFLATRDES